VLPQYLTAAEVAEALGISRAGVYKLISRGKLPAVRLSERNLRVSRLALDAYSRRLQAGLQSARRLEVRKTDPAALRESFEAATGMTPAEWQRRWEAGQLDDTAENMAFAIDASWLVSCERAVQQRAA
jgi:excisionase family DNA binding protein